MIFLKDDLNPSKKISIPRVMSKRATMDMIILN